MSTPNPDDVECLIEALRADLPESADRERSRARLIAAGVAVAGAGAASVSGISSAAAASAAGGSGALGAGASAAKSVQLGLWSKLASLSVAQKVGLAAAALTVAGSAVPAAPKVWRAVSGETTVMELAAPHERARARVSVPSRAPAPPAVPNLPLPLPESALAVINNPNPEPAVATRASNAPEAGKGKGTLADRVLGGRGELVDQASARPAVPEPESLPVPQAAPSTLRDETDLLEQALAALAAHDAPAAQRWLDLHAQRFPNGLLARERERAALRLKAARSTEVRNPP